MGSSGNAAWQINAIRSPIATSRSNVMYLRAIPILVAALLSACSHPPHQLRDSGGSKTFTVAQSSDVVFRKVVEGARTCYSRWEVAADYFPDNKTGRVSMSAKTSMSINSLFLVEVSAIEAETKVQVYFLKGNPVFATAVEAWAQGDYSNCPFT